MAIPQKNQKDPYSLKGFRVLIAEDYPFMADLVTSMIRELGVGNILLANGGTEAKEMIMMFNADPGSPNHIDMVITDWLMPDGDGADLIKWIRNSRKDAIKFLPVVLCSAYTSEDIVFVARDSGANEALVKPISAKKMSGRILHVINHPRAFIKCSDFFGPDRRRKAEKFTGEEKRVMKAEELKEFNEKL